MDVFTFSTVQIIDYGVVFFVSFDMLFIVSIHSQLYAFNRRRPL